MRLTFVALLVLLGLPAAARAQAQARPVFVWSIADKRLPDDLRRQLIPTVEARLRAAGDWQVVEPTRKQWRVFKKVKRGCKPPGAPDCARQVAEAMAVGYVLVLRPTRRGELISLTVRMVSAEAGRTLAEQEGQVKTSADLTGVVDQLLALPELTPAAPPAPESTDPPAGG